MTDFDELHIYTKRRDCEHFSAVTENTAIQTILVCSAH